MFITTAKELRDNMRALENAKLAIIATLESNFHEKIIAAALEEDKDSIDVIIDTNGFDLLDWTKGRYEYQELKNALDTGGYWNSLEYNDSKIVLNVYWGRDF